jgi:small ligand-binding sensory domain FIST
MADGVWQGGLSGVAFSADVALVSRVTQGCQPVGPARRVTAPSAMSCSTLDGEPALPCLLQRPGPGRPRRPARGRCRGCAPRWSG